jgi:hypothetical protein
VAFFTSPFPFPLTAHGDELYWPSLTLGLCVASARIRDCFAWFLAGAVSLSLISLDRFGLWSVVISWVTCQHPPPSVCVERETYLEGLGVPILHPLDRGHLVQSIGQVAQLLHAVREPDGELFREELRGSEEGSYYSHPEISECWAAEGSS